MSHATDFAVELARLIQFDNVEVAIQVVAMNFAHEEPAALVEGHRRGFADEGFGRDDFETEARGKLDAAGTLGG